MSARGSIQAIILATAAIFIPIRATAQVLITPGDAFGRCATQKSIDLKIAFCTEATRSTTYPWILCWVYLELARAHRARGETDRAIVNYARSLAAQENAAVRGEMDSLIPLMQ